MFKYILIIFAASSSEAFAKPFRFKAHQKIGPAPKPIKFDGFTHLDIDQYRPPSHLVEFDQILAAQSAIEAEGKAKLVEEEAGFKNVAKEFMESDLHKDAVSAKYEHIVG
jgi:hypothetical protein